MEGQLWQEGGADSGFCWRGDGQGAQGRSQQGAGVAETPSSTFYRLRQILSGHLPSMDMIVA